MTQRGASLQVFLLGVWMNFPKLLQEESSGESQQALRGTPQISKLVCYSVLNISCGGVFPPGVNKDRKWMLSESQGKKK